PGMLYATVERCPEFRGKIGGYRKERVLKMPGVKTLVEIPTTEGFYFVNTGIAVIADSYWAATAARAKLDAEWQPGPHHAENTESYWQQMRQLSQKPGLQTHHNQGDVDKALAAKPNAAVRAVYEMPFLAHAALEPLNCTVHVEGDKCTFWGGTQDIGGAAGAISEALKIPKENVTVNLEMVGGSFGRRIFQDFVIEAALIAKAANAPVKLIWTREDEMQHDFYRPMAHHRLEAALDTQGKPAAWKHRIVTTPIPANANASDTQLDVYESEVGGASNLPYFIPNRRCEYQPFECGVPRGYWRGVALSQTSFATESFIDELARRTNQDPLRYRLSLMEGHPLPPHPEGRDIYFHPYEMARLTNVLKLAAERFGWTKKPTAGHGKGIACCAFHNAYVALAAEVAVAKNTIRVLRVTAAVDSGLVINPKSAEAQVQGAILQGLSVALHGEITVQDGGVRQHNFHDSKWLRINEAPRIDVHFVQNDQSATSIGEIALPPVAPAVGNAIFDATRKRLRTLPFRLA
ncbi:MAG: molybdopterin-dependent oxidoreductase, partial [Cytophagales bacterium]|nr:molybdopterin-dependent oxidoreductase [Cytophagales bacterium]